MDAKDKEVTPTWLLLVTTAPDVVELSTPVTDVLLLLLLEILVDVVTTPGSIFNRAIHWGIDDTETVGIETVANPLGVFTPVIVAPLPGLLDKEASLNFELLLKC